MKDAESTPAPGTNISVRRAGVEFHGESNASGSVSFTLPSPGDWEIAASLEGFESVVQVISVGMGERIELAITLVPGIERRDSVTVKAAPPGADDAGAAPVTVSRNEVEQLPSRPANVRDALPLMPGVTRTPEGKLRIADRPEPSSLMLLNSIDVTDPATGDFGATAPIDAVATIDLHRSPFLAEYGRFTAAVVAVSTRGGEDKWRYELNDPTPEMRIFDAHLRGVRAFTPRFSVRGPLVKNKLYLAQSIEYALRKTPVRALPFPFNETKTQGWNALTQFDYVPSARHMFTLTLHGAPQKWEHAGLDFYNPQPATPDYSGHEARAGLTHRWQTGGEALESAVSFGRNRAEVWGKGPEDFVYGVVENGGNYFSGQDRRADRWQWRESYVFAPQGRHQVTVGGTLLYTRLRNRWNSHTVTVRDLEDRLLRRIEYTSYPGFDLTDTEAAVYVQDRWSVGPGFSLDTGMRADYQDETGVTRLGPRLGASWAPFQSEATTVRGGVGWFYDRSPLSLFGWTSYPWQTVTEFANSGDVIDGPRPYRNTLGGGRRPFLSTGGRGAAGFAPWTLTWSTALEHRFPRWVTLRATYVENDGRGLVVVRPERDDDAALVLEGEGQSWHRSVELLSRWQFYKENSLMVSYVHSWTRGNLNDFTQFLGNFPEAIVRDDVTAQVAGTIPHRFLTWGMFPLTESWRFSPMVEYRSGFPYITVDERQEYAGRPNERRFPRFFSLDFRVSKDILFKKHMFRLSFSMFNVTNHWNPTAVRQNIADPQFGEFLGPNKRRFRLDFDILF